VLQYLPIPIRGSHDPALGSTRRPSWHVLRGQGSKVPPVTLTIAHRGDPVNHWGNTLPAFDSAAALGADMVELDCRLTSDGQVVVVHDETLAQPWGVRRPVAKMTWDEVSALGRCGSRIPRLAEALSAVALPLMVDVPSVMVLEASLAVVKGANALDRCVFAGHTDALVRLRQIAPSARIALSWEKFSLPHAELLASTKPEWFNPHWPLATRRVVDQMHTAGLGVSVWTVDRKWQMRRVLRAGVDAVITNRTARFVSLVQKIDGQTGGTGPGPPS
jgi:glycerophosphoryl diester phosphodiesterase